MRTWWAFHNHEPFSFAGKSLFFSHFKYQVLLYDRALEQDKTLRSSRPLCLKLQPASEPSGALLKHNPVGPNQDLLIQSVWGGAQVCEYIRSSHVLSSHRWHLEYTRVHKTTPSVDGTYRNLLLMELLNQWYQNTENHSLLGAEVQIAGSINWNNLNCNWWMAGGSVWTSLRLKNSREGAVLRGTHNFMSFASWNPTRFSG